MVIRSAPKILVSLKTTIISEKYNTTPTVRFQNYSSRRSRRSIRKQTEYSVRSIRPDFDVSKRKNRINRRRKYSEFR